MRSRRALLGCATASAGAALVAGAVVPGWLGRSAPLAAASGGAAPATPLSRPLTGAPIRAAARLSCPTGNVVPLGSPTRAYAVTVSRRAVAYRRPGAGKITAFGRLNVNGVPTVFLALAARVDSSCRAVWYRVQLPLRPNGASGWVRAAAVSARQVATRILVDLSQRRVTLYRSGIPVLVATAAIGSRATPTPTGRYYVNQKLVAPDPLGAYGPAALGISAFSPVLKSWVQGGPIAIHGTNEATLLGSAVSHGCIRVRNADVLRLFKLVPTGTPVLIRM